MAWLWKAISPLEMSAAMDRFQIVWEAQGVPSEVALCSARIPQYGADLALLLPQSAPSFYRDCSPGDWAPLGDAALENRAA